MSSCHDVASLYVFDKWILGSLSDQICQFGKLPRLLKTTLVVRVGCIRTEISLKARVVSVVRVSRTSVELIRHSIKNVMLDH